MLKGNNMNRPQRVRAVYQELRHASHGSVASGDLLDYAAQLVDSFFKEETPRFDLRLGGRPLDVWGLDAVFADGGWRVLDRYPIHTFDSAEEAVNDPLPRRELESLGLEMYA
jgi:hypothetical protein